MSLISSEGGTTSHLDGSGLGAETPSIETVNSKLQSSDVIAGYGVKENACVELYSTRLYTMVPVIAYVPTNRASVPPLLVSMSVKYGILAWPSALVVLNVPAVSPMYARTSAGGTFDTPLAE